MFVFGVTDLHGFAQNAGTYVENYSNCCDSLVYQVSCARPRWRAHVTARPRGGRGGGEVAILYGATLSRRKVANLSPAWHCLQRGVDEWVAVLADESLISLTNYTHWELTCSPLENLRINLSRKSWYFGLFLDGPGYSLTPRKRLNSGPFVLTWTQELYQKRKGNVNAS